jgi:hypothetical protein
VTTTVRCPACGHQISFYLDPVKWGQEPFSCPDCRTPMRRGTWMGTYTGRKFWPLDPRAEDVDVLDVAHHLAMTCRYGGAVRRFYSVAEHSVLVSAHVAPDLAREALFHDAAEAYVGDLIRPLKHQPELAGFRAAEDRIYPVVMEAFGIASTPESRAAISEVDDRIIVDETQALMTRPEKYPVGRGLGCFIVGFIPHQARNRFLARYEELFDE